MPEGEQTHAVTVFSAEFAAPDDANYDQWPDQWVRRTGPRYPRYLPITIAEESSAPDGRCLRLELDGGNAVVSSGPAPTDPLFSYVLETSVLLEGGEGNASQRRNAGLETHRAFCSLTFFDAKDQPLGAPLTSRALGRAPQWETLRIGPITPPAGAVSARVGLHLEAPGPGDLFGAALFDRVTLNRLPRLTIIPSKPRGWFTNPADASLRVEASGVLDAELALELTLRAADGREMVRETRKLRGRRETLTGAAPVYTAALDWHLPLEENGWYEALVTMNGVTRRMPLVVLPELPAGIGGEFGWTLPPLEDSLSVDELTPLLVQAGIGWVKIPVWHSEQQSRAAEHSAALADRLATRQIRVVGLLDQPPPDARRLFSGEGELPVASVFLEPSLWQPVVDPVMARLSLRIQWWQLGSDGDTSFAGHPKLQTTIDGIRRHMNRFGQEVKVGMNWPWLETLPTEQAPAWSFLMLREETPFTERELATYLTGSQSAASRWVSVQPLARDHYDLPTRLRDLVLRMVAAKQAGAAGIFVSQPFDEQRGLLHADGSPGELFPGWRTTASLLAGAEFLGSLNLPGGSRNLVFARGGEAVMVIWSEREQQEQLYLGDSIRRIDVWGRVARCEAVGGEQIVPCGPMPAFITGLSLPVARWRMDFRFDQDQLASIFGRPQSATYRFRNHFPQGVGGEITLNTPSVWDANPRRVGFRLMAGEETVRTLEVLLRNDASSGPQPLRIDFDITADRNYKFSIYRNMDVGLGDVTIELSTRRNENGDLIVEQQLINHTDEFVNFNCVLRAPRRRRMRERVLNAGRGSHTTVYVIPNGDDLVGESLWLQAEEIEGERMLNYRFTVQ